MSEFNEDLIQATFVAEGGEADSDNDLGGHTKYGISAKAFPGVDISNLTEQDAISLWKSKYWDAYRLSEINNQLLADEIFDMFLNMSNISAATTVQLALNACGCQVVLDGVMGSGSINAANNVTPAAWLTAELKVQRVIFYLGRVDANPSQLDNFRSWIRRTIK